MLLSSSLSQNMFPIYDKYHGIIDRDMLNKNNESHNLSPDYYIRQW